MSEFQYYDFYAVDRPLTSNEKDTISTFSSRSNPSSRRATFVYHYGGFREKEEEVLNKYFDMMLYYANWGSRRLMIKIPTDLISFDELKAYNYDGDGDYEEYVRVSKKKSNLIIDLYYNEEDGDWMDTEGLLDRMLPLRTQILEGDYRLLYLAWLQMASRYPQMSDDQKESPLPANLRKLDPALETFADFWNINDDLIAAASEKSTKENPPSEENLADRISQLSDEEKTDFLKLMLSNEGQAKLKLTKRLMEFFPKSDQDLPSPRTLTEIRNATSRQRDLRLEKERKKSAEAYRKKMEKIGRLQESTWKEAESNVNLKTAKGYEIATALIKELKDYAAFSENTDDFEMKFDVFFKKYGKSLAFRRRLGEKGIIR